MMMTGCGPVIWQITDDYDDFTCRFCITRTVDHFLNNPFCHLWDASLMVTLERLIVTLERLIVTFERKTGERRSFCVRDSKQLLLKCLFYIPWQSRTQRKSLQIICTWWLEFIEFFRLLGN
jgi:hypothetical protein